MGRKRKAIAVVRRRLRKMVRGCIGKGGVVEGLMWRISTLEGSDMLVAKDRIMRGLAMILDLSYVGILIAIVTRMLDISESQSHGILVGMIVLLQTRLVLFRDIAWWAKMGKKTEVIGIKVSESGISELDVDTVVAKSIAEKALKIVVEGLAEEIEKKKAELEAEAQVKADALLQVAAEEADALLRVAAAEKERELEAKEAEEEAEEVQGLS